MPQKAIVRPVLSLRDTSAGMIQLSCRRLQKRIRNNAMPANYHAIVWIDHREARIFHFSLADVNRIVIHPHRPSRRVQHEAGAIGGDGLLDEDFFERVTAMIAGAKAILITGPLSAKSELAAHLSRRHPDLALCVKGVETINHPSDGALVAVARLHFKAGDRPRPHI